MRTKLNHLPEMAKTIRIHEQSLTPAGMEIHYTIRGRNERIRTNAAGAACLLMLAGHIRGYRFQKGRLLVSQDITEPVVTASGKLSLRRVGRSLVTWSYFVRNFRLSDEVSKSLVCRRHRAELAE